MTTLTLAMELLAVEVQRNDWRTHRKRRVIGWTPQRRERRFAEAVLRFAQHLQTEQRVA